MMDWTDRLCRVFHRQLTGRARLYTEMITAQAVLRGARVRLLGFDSVEQPLALQLGGSDRVLLAEAAAVGAEFGYDEINLNIGCPSDRVQEGRFGACLMAEPELVAASVVAMRASVHIPVTVKCRIGIDDQDSERDFRRFIDTVADAGCTTFIVHARKAWLNGLSPKDNREIPPLDYARVYRLKIERPDLTVVLNGGIETLGACERHLAHVDGVMMGRAAYHNPALLGDVDRVLFDASMPTITREQAGRAMVGLARDHIADGGRLASVTRHMLGLYHGRPRGRLYRRYLSENATDRAAAADVLSVAIDLAEFGQAGHASRDAA